MRTIITTNNGTIIDGKLCMFGKSIVTIDVINLPAYKATKLIDEGIEMTKYPHDWHLTIPRGAVHSFELLDEENQPQAE